MKIIDLLNKIANGEEVPKIIVCGAEEDKHYYNKDLKEYINQRTGEKLFEDGYGKFLKYFLNDEIEIIKENPTLNDIREIYELPRIEEKKIEYVGKTYDLTTFAMEYSEAAIMLKDMGNKLKEIIDKLNTL